MAPHLAAKALEGLSGPVRVLDIAAGHGLFGIAVARQAPDAIVVAQDWAAVLEVAKANAQKAGVADRIELLPGSAFDVNFGGPYDAVLLTNFLHHFDFPTCVTLLKKIRAAMRPGGRLVTLEFVPNDDRVTPPVAAGFALTMRRRLHVPRTGSYVQGSGFQRCSCVLRAHRTQHHRYRPRRLTKRSGKSTHFVIPMRGVTSTSKGSASSAVRTVSTPRVKSAP
jgi:ubiquinone/menaquinone biosynthesis C-methylase UbiE